MLWKPIRTTSFDLIFRGMLSTFFRIQRDHLPFLVLADDREEVEQILDVRLALLGVALAAGGVLRKVVANRS